MQEIPCLSDKNALKRLAGVFAPQVVGVPPANAIRDLMLLPDGEIRHYGFRGDFRTGNIHPVVLCSPDFGFSWIERDVPGDCPGATVRSPWSGDYLTVLPHHGRLALEEYQSVHSACPSPGIYLHRSAAGPDGPFTTRRIGDLFPSLLIARQPMALRSRRRWVLPAQGAADAESLQCPMVFLSDDDGAAWRTVFLPAIPRYGQRWPHAGLRWEMCGEEPTIAELSDGRLQMLIRTAHDEHWESFSADGGETWSQPVPSRFYGTITTPLLFRMSDGRLIVFWNNTTPLPEVDPSLHPELSAAAREGLSEDFFTNRDALHAAISDDEGETWRGFRELHLNERRNDHDFRTHGSNDVSVDKSIHQSQTVELPHGKILLAFGQHPDCRRIILFDPDWLYETGRRADFFYGLEDWSIHQYFKSIAGVSRDWWSGHCALNRHPGASLKPHPQGGRHEVLHVARYADDRLMEEKQGAVWNFPAGHAGRLEMRVCQPPGSAGTQICLADRWFNPTDPVVASFSQCVLDLDGSGRINGHPALRLGEWHCLRIQWNLSQKPAAAFQVDDGEMIPLSLAAPTKNGMSYLHLQSAATHPDPHGLLIESVEKTGNG